MDGDTGQGGPILRLQVELKRFILDIRHLTLIGELGGCPLTSHKAGRQAGGLHVPAWQPGVVGLGGGTLRVRAKNSAIQVLLLVAVDRACVHNVIQVLPEEIINIKSSSI